MAEDAPETVGKAALLNERDNRIFTGINHGEAYLNAEDHYGIDNTPDRFAHGFMTSHGRFVTREEASAIADKTYQVPKEDQLSLRGQLMSEDLNPNAWDEPSFNERWKQRSEEAYAGNPGKIWQLQPKGAKFQAAVEAQKLGQPDPNAQRRNIESLIKIMDQAKIGSGLGSTGNLNPTGVPGTKITDLY